MSNVKKISYGMKKDCKLEAAHKICVELLQKGYIHFYLKGWLANVIWALLKLQKQNPNILIFVVHDRKIKHWIYDEITNLPIYSEEYLDGVDGWLEKFCEICNNS